MQNAYVSLSTAVPVNGGRTWDIQCGDGSGESWTENFLDSTFQSMKRGLPQRRTKYNYIPEGTAREDSTPKRSLWSLLPSLWPTIAFLGRKTPKVVAGVLYTSRWVLGFGLAAFAIASIYPEFRAVTTARVWSAVVHHQEAREEKDRAEHARLVAEKRAAIEDLNNKIKALEQDH